jgi:uncharacterized membrane protein YphA (DoxX/SURF4 family)
MIALLGPLGLLVLVIVLVALSISLTPRPGPDAGINRASRFFLVLLRLSIGWHFLFEAVDKFSTATWSSEPYLREAEGPLAGPYRELAGDPVKDLVMVTYDANGKPALPQRLSAQWDVYLERYIDHYGLDPEQRIAARTRLDQARARAVKWMTTEKRTVTLPSSLEQKVTAELTVPQRVAQYEADLDRARRIEANEQSVTGKNAAADAQTIRKQANGLRNDIRKELGLQTKALTASLDELLTAEQRAKGAPSPVTRPPLQYWTPLDWSDAVVKWGLLFVGLFLIGGLFTRTACVAAALFLLAFYLPHPPLPGLPENPRSEGHYLYINKNIIEMLALLALATTRSGRWAGLDGLLQFLFPGRRRLARSPRGTAVPETVASR